MSTNNKVYAKAYYKRQRKALFRKLGGKCAMCGTYQDLITHRIYTPANSKTLFDEKQRRFRLNIREGEVFQYLEDGERGGLDKKLLTNPDNMLLVCKKCLSVLRRKYGRKHKIGRHEILNTLEEV